MKPAVFKFIVEEAFLRAFLSVVMSVISEG
jgi:hypothetical protein